MKQRVGEILFDFNESYGCIRLRRELRDRLPEENRLEVLDCLVGLHDAVAALYVAALDNDQEQWAKVTKIVADPWWGPEEKAVIRTLSSRLK